MVLQNIPDDVRLSNATIYGSQGLLQLSDIYKLELGKFMHKAYYKALPQCLNDMFKCYIQILTNFQRISARAQQGSSA